MNAFFVHFTGNVRAQFRDYYKLVSDVLRSQTNFSQSIVGYTIQAKYLLHMNAFQCA